MNLQVNTIKNGTCIALGVMLPHAVLREAVRVDRDLTKPGLHIGEWSSATAGYGVAISATLTKAWDVSADDGGVALTAGAYRAARHRMLLTKACAAGDISVYGHESHLKVVADYSAATGILGGEWGYLELASGGKVNVGGAVVGHVDVPTGAYAISHVAAFLGKSNDLGGTHTGTVSGIYFPNPGAGTFDALLDLDAATGMTQATAAGSGGSTYLKVIIGGVLHTVQASHA